MKSFLLLILLACSFPALAQPGMKVVAYSQAFTPGMIRQRDIPSENGGSTGKQPLVNINYYIYVLVASKANPAFRQLWINGQWYKIAGTTIQKSPVQIESPSTKLLVPATEKKVIQLERGDSLHTSNKPSSSLSALMKRSALIISYTWKGKTCYLSLKTIEELERMMAQ